MSDLSKRIAQLSPEKRELLLRRLNKQEVVPQLKISRQPRESNIFPLSFAQARLWFLDQLEPGSSLYNIPTVVQLTGPLNIEALEQSLNEIVRRHESLRTTFGTKDDQPVQIIHPTLTLPLQVLDLQKSEQIEQLLATAGQQPFDLTQAPLVRATLLRQSATEHLLVFVIHHIVSDGWSMGVLVQELITLYAAFNGEGQAQLPELPIQYVDFAVWQREWLTGTVLDTQLTYWKQQLDNNRPILDLPTDHPRPPVQTFTGKKQLLTLPKHLTQALLALSQQENATLFITLLAVFQVLLHRYTKQDDILVGTPIANRNRGETEQLIGMFVNTLVLRTDLTGNPSFRQLLRRVREVALSAYAHQDLPFEKLVEELQPERDLSRNPIFQVWFSLNNSPMPSLEVAGLSLKTLEVDNGISQFDLSLNLIEQKEELVGAFEYNSDLFDADTISRMIGHFQTLLTSIVTDPDQRLEDLPLLTKAEEHQILVKWNDTCLEYPGDVCIHDLFAAQVERTPEAIAVIFKNQQLTYRELNERANRLASHLQKLSVTSEIIVGIHVERSLEMMVAILAVLKAGGAYLPLDPVYPQERLRYMLEDAGVAVVLTQKRLQASLPQSAAFVVCLDADWPLIEKASADNPQIAIAPSNLAYVIYTSGSTGQPKGVMVAHGHAINFFAGMDRSIGNETPSTWLAVTSISFDISVLELLWTLTRGFQVVIQPEMLRATQKTEAIDTSILNKEMAFSLFYFASDELQGGADKYRLLLEGAKFADKHGFSAIWTPERHFHAFGGLYPNPSVVSAAIAAITKQIHIRAGSIVLPLQNPIRVAEEWSVVDNLSHGRVGVSFASGWHTDDFVLAPENFADRFQIMFREIETVRKLWRGESIKLTGGNGQDVEVKIHPQPLQSELPIWITAAGSPETFRMAGQVGANLLTHLLGQTVEELQEKIAIYRQAWQENGHQPGAGHVTLMIHTFVGKDLDFVREKVREPFCQYLKSSLGLMKNLARSLGWDINVESFTPAEEEQLLTHAFDRYFETSSLFGTPETCLQMINRLKSIGVDEVGCLIDFGVDCDSVLSGLEYLNTVKEWANTNTDDSLAAQISKYQVSHLQCTPSMARMLTLEPKTQSAFGSLRKLMLGGEALPISLAQHLQTMVSGEILNMYGPTETTIWSATYALPEVGGEVAIGRPIANTQIYILNDYLQPVPIGVPGEIYIGGQGVVRGYLEKPELTAARFIPNPFGVKVGDRLYKTGDLARYLPDGNIEFLGRVDHQVKIHGYRIELGEIETVLGEHPDIAEAVVIEREDQPGDKRLVAYVIPHQTSRQTLRPQLTPAEQAHLFAKHKHYTLPNGLVIAHLSDLQATAGYREVIEEEIYLKHGITLKEGDCVFDVGANIGFFTLFVNQKCRNVQIYAFEPIAPTFEVLQTNVKLYGLDVKLFPVGLSNQTETAEFTFYPEMAGLSGRYSETNLDKRVTKAIIKQDLQQAVAQGNDTILLEQDLDEFLEKQFHSETYICQLTTLSDVIRQHNVQQIDLLKIDVEKAEFEVLCGIQDRDWEKIKQIVMEVDTKENLDNIVTLLSNQGFHVVVDDFVVVDGNEQEPGVEVYMLYASRVKRDSSQPLSSTANNRTLSTTDLRAFLKSRLPEYMVPSTFVLISALPLTPNGKVNRRELPVPAGFRPELEVSYVMPKTEIEQAIASIWQSLLQIERVGVNDNFFELGGTSLLVVQARTQLREKLGHDISLVDLFQYPTISALAQYLNQKEENTGSFEKVRSSVEKQKMAQRQRRANQARRGK